MLYNRSSAARIDLLEMIREGSYSLYSFLPSERLLGSELGVGRGSIRAIERDLCQAGVLRYVPQRRRYQVLGFEERHLQRILVVCDSLHPNAFEAMRILDGIHAAATGVGASVVLNFINHTSYDSSSLLARYQAQEFQGIIHLEYYEPPVQQKLLSHGVPVLVANNERDEDCPGVRIDYRAIGRLAGRHLVKAGHRRIAMLGGGANSYIYREMLAGLKGALAEEDIFLDAACILRMEHGADVFARLRQLFSSPSCPTAIFAGRDHWAASIYSCCRELQMKIPQQISVVSYDGLSWPAGKDYGLCTILEPAEEIGRQSVELLYQWVEKNSPDRQCILGGQLREGKSVKTIP